MRIGEINIVCRDLQRSRHFYCDLLGIEALEMEGPSALHCRVENARLLLLAFAQEENASNRPYCRRATVSFDLLVPDLSALVTKLEAEGASFAERDEGVSAFVYDPDGNVVELLQADSLTNT